MEVILNFNRHCMPSVLVVTPSGLPPQDPCTQLFFLLIVGLLLTYSKISRFAMLAKPFPVSGPTYLPQIPKQVPCMSKGALVSWWPEVCQLS